MNELIIPEEAINDPNSFEILRVWAANNEQYVSIHSGLNGAAYDFGYMLAQLAIHGAKLYSVRNKILEQEMLKDILEGFNNEIENNTGDPAGSISQ